ncbi:MAG: LacI family DNA-binding transcriptional regulator [Armatimonadota bacterium]|nr:LacI family DNA-binding transcriptional regulator [Armatimonadota bacterium]MDR7456197.1 LacI family DNA-binding transcriptional regulator [Armatimonadota bacterium]MDR7496377.1 LacI family DNA-binding transcriptional regulator [Armatimonadota bacterium]
MTTIRDVARRAGVSVATAARALGDYGYTSPRTRQRVLRAARALDYHPNAIARSMIKGRTQTLAVVVSDNANPFFASVVRGIEDAVLGQGYAIILCNADEDPAKEALYLRAIRQKRVDGLVISPSGGPGGLLRGLMASGIPIVQVDRRLARLPADAVVVDNRAGVRAAIEHLVRLGHRRIGLLGGPRRLYTGRERLQAYLAAMREARLPVADGWVLEGTFKEASGHALVGRFLRLRRRPTAIVVANNLMTIGALLALKEAGVRIPEEMAVVGFDDMDWAPILTPPLTAIAQPARDLGAAAGALLLERVTGAFAGRPRTVVLQPRLVVRESCGTRAAPSWAYTEQESRGPTA